jgi:type I restriction enzyme S subunit
MANEDNWKIERLRKCVEINSDTLHSNTDVNYQFRYIDISSVTKGTINIPMDTISFGSAPSRARRIFIKGDILFGTVRPYLQSHAYIDFDVKDMIGSTGFAVLRAKSKVDNKYLYHYIFSDEIKKQIDSLLVGSNYPAINSNDVGNLLVNLPPLPEQKKIAEILSTWDEAIEFNEKLLDTEKQQKSVYVSNIYTKRHVTNIENVKKFEKLSKHLVEKTERNRDELTNDVLSVSNTRGFVLQSAQFEREIASKDKNNYKVVRKGQFAYNPSRVNVGSIDQLSERDSGIISPMYVVFECKDSINGRYLYHFLKSDYFLRLIPRFTQGSVRDSLSFDGLCEMKIHIPTIDKQIRYSSLLDTIDKKIDLLERNIVCLKTQKQGLMQRLLTGKVRVKLD